MKFKPTNPTSLSSSNKKSRAAPGPSRRENGKGAAAVKKARRDDGDKEVPAKGGVNPAVSISSSLPTCVAKVGSSISIMSDLTDPTAIGQFQNAEESVAIPSVQYSDRNIEPTVFENLLGMRSASPPLVPAIPH